MAAAIIIVLVVIYSKMGRTIPSFRIVLAMEEERKGMEDISQCFGRIR